MSHYLPSAVPWWHYLSRELPLVLLILGLAACGGDRSRRGPPGEMGPGEGGPRVATPRMEAHGMLFDGQLEVETLLARSGAQWAKGDETGTSSSGGRKSGGGGFRGSAGGFGGGRGGGRGGRGDGRGGSSEAGADENVQRAPPIHASNLPSMELRLRLTNHGPAPVDVQVIDFNSALGNFVVQPAKITLPPDQPIEADPMVSRLGVGSEEIPLTVRIHIEGRTEQQVLTLRIAKETAPESPPPAPTVPAGPSL